MVNCPKCGYDGNVSYRGYSGRGMPEVSNYYYCSRCDHSWKPPKEDPLAKVMIALLEEVPPSTVMWTTTEGSFSAGEIIEQLEAGEELGKQYASDVLRVTRDFMARQVHKEKKKDLLFTYPVFISTVADEKVTVVVSVDGRDMVVLVPANDFSFPIHEDMRCMVEGWRNKDGQKYLHFREIVPLQLDEEHSELLREIVECFKPG